MGTHGVCVLCAVVCDGCEDWYLVGAPGYFIGLAEAVDVSRGNVRRIT